MKILILNCFDKPISTLNDHLIKWSLKNIPQENIDIKSFLSEEICNENAKTHILDFLNPILLSKAELDSIFENKTLTDRQKYTKMYINGLAENEKELFQQIIKNKLGDWEPDIILGHAWETPSIILQNLYPRALCLSQENAIFCRPPFPRTLAYDPFGTLDTFFNRFAEQIKSLKISKNENKIIENFKKNLRELINKNSPITKELKQYKKHFKKTILCPLVGSDAGERFGLAYYKNDFDLLEYIFKALPSDIGVFVTEHDATGILKGETLEYFRNKYPNFIFLDKTNIKGYSSNSLFYFDAVDAVMNTTSKTGFTALLWDKPIISLAYKYNDLIKDIDGVENIEQLWKKPIKNKNNILCWYFSNYATTAQDAMKTDFLLKFFEKKLMTFRTNGITFEFFDKVNDLEKTLDFILCNATKYYEKNKKADFFEFGRTTVLYYCSKGEIKEHYKQKLKNYVSNL